MNDIKLQKVILPPDVIDLSFGEPEIVMKALFRQLNRMGMPLKMPNIFDLLKWQYQPAAGKPDLVTLLEKKYESRVVITNGAKQALAAAMYAFKKQGINSIYYEQPYYPANPSIADSVGLPKSTLQLAGGRILTSPNNPDGVNLTNDQLIEAASVIPTIHDAAYYTEIYLPDGQKPIPVGDIQLFSMSKMYGLSGLRIGYAVIHNEKYYQDIVDYMELTTAGASTASQDIARNIEIFFKDNPVYYKEFTREAKTAIKESRKELLKLDPDVLQVEEPNSDSMFAWAKIGPALDHKTAKVHILPGEIFGKPGYMRLNIAYPPEVISEAVSRLNRCKIRS